MMVARTIKYLFLLLAAVGLPLSSCYYDNEETLYPGGQPPCDTTVVSYSMDIIPIFSSHCNTCHSGASASANIRTDNYSDLMIIVNNGRLRGSVNHASGYSPMPKNSGKLPACELARINAWLNRGAPQN